MEGEVVLEMDQQVRHLPVCVEIAGGRFLRDLSLSCCTSSASWSGVMGSKRDGGDLLVEGDCSRDDFRV